MRLYTIYDQVAEEAGPIFEAKHDAIARRQFDLLLRQEAVVSPKDFSLYCLGYFDREKILLTSKEKARRVESAFKASDIDVAAEKDEEHVG